MPKAAEKKTRVKPVAPERLTPTGKAPLRMPVAVRRDKPIRPDDLRPTAKPGVRRAGKSAD